MSRSLLLVAIAIGALIAIALAAPEPKHKKFHGGHHPGHVKSRKPRSADPAAYGFDDDDDDSYVPDYVPEDYNRYPDADPEYYGGFRQYGRGQRVGGRPGARRAFRRPTGRIGPVYIDPVYQQYQNYPNNQQYYDDDSDFAKKERVKKEAERVKKEAEKHRVKKDASSLLDKIGASIAKVVKQ